MSDKRLLVNAERSIESGDLAGAQREAEAVLERDARCAEAHYLLGEIARRRGESEAAQRHYRRAIQLEPRVACFHHGLGNALQDAARLDNAIDAYRRALRLAPEPAEIWNDLGTAYFASGQPGRAADCYRKAVQHAPAHVVALSNLGSTLRSLGDVRGAVGAYRRELWQRMAGILTRRGSAQRTLADDAERWRSRGSARLAGELADLALSENADDARALAIKAEIAADRGEAATAVELFERAAGASPKDPRLLVRLARVHRAHGDHRRAAEAFQRAMAAGERGAAVQRELALCLAAAGQTENARAALEKLVRQDPSVETWTALGRLRLDQGELALAEDALGRARSIDRAAAAPLAQLARLRVAQRDAAAALGLSEEALETDPGCVEAHFWHGRALGLLGKWQAASAAFAEAAALDTADVGIVRWLGLALRAADRIEESKTVLRDALARRPKDFDLRAELVASIFEGGNVVQAREMLENLLADTPDHAGALAAMSWILNVEGRLDEAEASGRRALDRDPGHVVAHQNLGLLLLKLGRYAEGWEHYGWRMKVHELAPAYMRFPYPEWRGEDLAGKTLLIYAEQGLGDEIMFASCVPDAMRQAKGIVLECDPRLGELFRRSFPGCAVFGRSRMQANAWTGSLEPPPDFQIALGSLASHWRRDRQQFPRHSGYLSADLAKVARWRKRLEALGPDRKIGIAWRGGVPKTGRAQRSLELSELAPLLGLDGLRFVSLQYGAVGDELARLERLHRIPILHAPEAIADYDECAGLIGALDGVLSVCTSIVHLTGALGRPALVMAPYSPEWRYGMSGEEMPWYPSVRVLRQPRPGDWASVFSQVRAALLEVRTA